jgi:DNA-binding Lrp family transcriptional regulator
MGERQVTENAVLARKVSVLSLEYLARVFQHLAGAFGDGRAGLIVNAILVANTAHLRGPQAALIAAPDGTFPDHVRAPVSIKRIAKSLGMPFETARMQVRRLVDAGICAQLDGGIIVPQSALQRPEVAGPVLANLDVVRQLVRDLRAVGLDDAPTVADAARPLEDDRVLASRMAVLTVEYVAGVFRALADVYGDGRAGLIVYAISAANTGRLDVRTRDPSIAGPEGILPDEVRLPVSITQVARSLGMPFETVRRQVHKLIDAGFCVQVEGGLIVPKLANQRPEVVRAVMENLEQVRQFVRDLESVGLDVGR